MAPVFFARKRFRTPGALAALAACFIPVAAHLHAADLESQLPEVEILQHFQALVQIDSSDPPGNESGTAAYLAAALEAAGIEVQTHALEAQRPNVVARLRGNGSKRPLLLMAHQDVVNVDPEKWQHPPFSATREGGWIYGRGTLDDKDSVTAGLMTLLALKRSGLELDRDVIFLAEAGEEGSTRIGIEYMVDAHFDAIDAEYCLAEGGSVLRQGGQVRYATVQTVEKLPRAIQLTSGGIAGHGSVPTRTNAVVKLARAVATVADWQPPLRLSDTTTAYFSRLAAISAPEEAARYRALLNPGSAEAAAALDYLKSNQPALAAILHTTITPTIIDAGYRVNVIPSEAGATLDVRLLPDEDPDAFLQAVREVVGDETVNVAWAPRNLRPPGLARLDTEVFSTLEAVLGEVYGATVLPSMSTGATDMAYLRAKGIQCYGIGPAIDAEDAPLGFGAHSDQERIIESELYRFVRAYYTVVERLVTSAP